MVKEIRLSTSQWASFIDPNSGINPNYQHDLRPQKQIPTDWTDFLGEKKLEKSTSSTESNAQSLVTTMANLINIVGNNETDFLASLTDEDYQGLVKILDDLIDVVGENETHILAAVMNFIGILIENYEDRHVPELMELQEKNVEIEQ